jgi:glycosyltransferase involved in cell wall biosynthesis
MRLLEAWARLPGDARPVLVLPGYSTPHEVELRSRAAQLGLEPDVRCLDWVSPADLEGLYALASSFVFPSLYEGFGLPVLEAMTRGVPVACSDRGSLAEVAGSAALLFDPESPQAIADAVQLILGDQEFATGLSLAGREHAERFTWKATAEATLLSYRRALASSP